MTPETEHSEARAGPDRERDRQVAVAGERGGTRYIDGIDDGDDANGSNAENADRGAKSRADFSEHVCTAQ